MLLVRQLAIAFTFSPLSLIVFRTKSTVSSAINLYVVHLPPATTITSLGVSFAITWSLDKSLEFVFVGSFANGRAPDHTERTSCRCGCKAKYGAMVSNM